MDDAQDLRDAIRDWLEGEGYEVPDAADGRAALTRPVPAWAPIGLAGVAALAIVLWRREASN